MPLTCALSGTPINCGRTMPGFVVGIIGGGGRHCLNLPLEKNFSNPVHSRSPSIWEAETGGPKGEVSPGLQSETISITVKYT